MNVNTNLFTSKADLLDNSEISETEKLNKPFSQGFVKTKPIVNYTLSHLKAKEYLKTKSINVEDNHLSKINLKNNERLNNNTEENTVEKPIENNDEIKKGDLESLLINDGNINNGNDDDNNKGKFANNNYNINNFNNNINDDFCYSKVLSEFKEVLSKGKSNSFEDIRAFISINNIKNELCMVTEENPNENNNLKPPEEEAPIRKGNYIMEKNIGEGAFGKVKKGYHIQTKEKVAIKILDKTIMNQEEGDFIRVMKEITILKKLRHKNIVQLYEIIESSRKLYLIMELCDKEMFDYIVENTKLPEFEACKYFQELIDAVEYLHIQSIVHRDLKPENLLLDSNKTLKLTDFGLSTIYGDDLLNTPCGTPSYAPPEMLKGEPYHGMLSDIWSCGVILYAMVCGYLPFSESNEDLNCKNIVEGKFEIPNTLSPILINLLSGILRTDPLERYDITQVKEDPWFNFIKPTCIPGLIIGIHEIPVDYSILEEMINEFINMDEETQNSIFNIIKKENTNNSLTSGVKNKSLAATNNDLECNREGGTNKEKIIDTSNTNNEALKFNNIHYLNDVIVDRIQTNKFDNITATYYLKVKSRFLKGIASVSDLQSDLYLRHISNSIEKHLQNTQYDIANGYNDDNNNENNDNINNINNYNNYNNDNMRSIQMIDNNNNNNNNNNNSNNNIIDNSNSEELSMHEPITERVEKNRNEYGLDINSPKYSEPFSITGITPERFNNINSKFSQEEMKVRSSYSNNDNTMNNKSKVISSNKASIKDNSNQINNNNKTPSCDVNANFLINIDSNNSMDFNGSYDISRDDITYKLPILNPERENQNITNNNNNMNNNRATQEPKEINRSSFAKNNDNKLNTKPDNKKQNQDKTRETSTNNAPAVSSKTNKMQIDRTNNTNNQVNNHKNNKMLYIVKKPVMINQKEKKSPNNNIEDSKVSNKAEEKDGVNIDKKPLKKQSIDDETKNKKRTDNRKMEIAIKRIDKSSNKAEKEKLVNNMTSSSKSPYKAAFENHGLKDKNSHLKAVNINTTNTINAFKNNTNNNNNKNNVTPAVSFMTLSQEPKGKQHKYNYIMKNNSNLSNLNDKTSKDVPQTGFKTTPADTKFRYTPTRIENKKSTSNTPNKKLLENYSNGTISNNVVENNNKKLVKNPNRLQHTERVKKNENNKHTKERTIDIPIYIEDKIYRNESAPKSLQQTFQQKKKNLRFNRVQSENYNAIKTLTINNNPLEDQNSKSKKKARDLKVTRNPGITKKIKIINDNKPSDSNTYKNARNNTGKEELLSRTYNKDFSNIYSKNTKNNKEAESRLFLREAKATVDQANFTKWNNNCTMSRSLNKKANYFSKEKDIANRILTSSCPIITNNQETLNCSKTDILPIIRKADADIENNNNNKDIITSKHSPYKKSVIQNKKTIISKIPKSTNFNDENNYLIEKNNHKAVAIVNISNSSYKPYNQALAILDKNDKNDNNTDSSLTDRRPNFGNNNKHINKANNINLKTELKITQDNKNSQQKTKNKNNNNNNNSYLLNKEKASEYYKRISNCKSQVIENTNNKSTNFNNPNNNNSKSPFRKSEEGFYSSFKKKSDSTAISNDVTSKSIVNKNSFFEKNMNSSSKEVKDLSFFSIIDVECIYATKLFLIVEKLEEVFKSKKISFVKIGHYRFKCSKSGICFNSEIFKVNLNSDAFRPGELGGSNFKITSNILLCNQNKATLSMNENTLLSNDTLDIKNKTSSKSIIGEEAMYYLNFKIYSGDLHNYRKILIEVKDSLNKKVNFS